jgi:hypothetical protein
VIIGRLKKEIEAGTGVFPGSAAVRLSLIPKLVPEWKTDNRERGFWNDQSLEVSVPKLNPRLTGINRE